MDTNLLERWSLKPMSNTPNSSPNISNPPSNPPVSTPYIPSHYAGYEPYKQPPPQDYPKSSG